MEMLSRNAANMSDLEMKGFIFNAIQKADSKKLERYVEIVEFIEFEEEVEDMTDVETPDYRLTPEQEAELEEAIAQTYDPTMQIDHEEVMKKYAKWLK